MSDEREQAIRERLEKASCGPWRFEENAHYVGDMGSIISRVGDRVCWFGDAEQYYPNEGEPPNEHDLAFILAAPTDVAYLLDALASSRQAVEALRGELNQVNRAIAEVNADMAKSVRSSLNDYPPGHPLRSQMEAVLAAYDAIDVAARSRPEEGP